MNIASYIDHTLLKPAAPHHDVALLCKEAIEYNFAAVCVAPCYVKLAKQLLEGSDVKLATVIGFPWGYNTIETKLAEISCAINDGADELDIVHNLSALKSGGWNYLREEIAACVEVASGLTTKIIIESGSLTDEEIIKCCELYSELGIDMMKTSTGFAETGATVHAVSLMRSHLPENIGIKASGGIRTFAFAQELIAAGATRIGTSAGAGIVKESKEA